MLHTTTRSTEDVKVASMPSGREDNLKASASTEGSLRAVEPGKCW